MQAYIMYMMPNINFLCSKGGVIIRKIIPHYHCLGQFDDVNNQLIVRDYMPMKTLQVLSYMALHKGNFWEGSQWWTNGFEIAIW